MSEIRNQQRTIYKDYVQKAEEIMYKVTKEDLISTSKIRGLMAQIIELYNDIILEKSDILKQEYVEKILHLKVKMLYDAGRDRAIEKRRTLDIYPEGKLTEFFKRTELLVEINKVGNSRKEFIKLFNYFEALVAYHKFYGGKE